LAYLIGILRNSYRQVDENHPFAQGMRPNRYGLEISTPNN
jgi:hypothetical protein